MRRSTVRFRSPAPNSTTTYAIRLIPSKPPSYSYLTLKNRQYVAIGWCAGVGVSLAAVELVSRFGLAVGQSVLLVRAANGFEVA